MNVTPSSSEDPTKCTVVHWLALLPQWIRPFCIEIWFVYSWEFSYVALGSIDSGNMILTAATVSSDVEKDQTIKNKQINQNKTVSKFTCTMVLKDSSFGESSSECSVLPADWPQPHRKWGRNSSDGLNQYLSAQRWKMWALSCPWTTSNLQAGKTEKIF